jgi:raffinose/stachyose/melibiose transport system permease protein
VLSGNGERCNEGVDFMDNAVTLTARTNRKHISTAHVISHFFLIIFAALIVYPLLWMINQSLKISSEMYTNPWGLPQKIIFENYELAWTRANMGIYLTNSLRVTVITVILILIVASLSAYAFSRFKFPGNKLIYSIFVLSLILPVPLFTLYSVVSGLGLVNTHWALIFTYTSGALPMSIFLLKPTFDSVPMEIEESAKIDGCNSVRTFLQIVIPLSKPGLATVTIFQTMNAWNEFMYALVFIRRQVLRTVPLGLQVFFQENSTDWPQLFASLCMITIPIFIVYAIMQKQFIEGLTAGALKM